MKKSIYRQDERFEFLSFIKQNKYKKYVILVDSKSNGFCVPVLKSILPFFKTADTVIFPDSEENKSIPIASFIWSEFEKLNVNKETLIINLGGGIVCDMGAFCAATFKRGIDFINIPTTLLAMVDAACGGKNGVNFDQIKNLIGTYKNPQAIYIDKIFLKSLPKRTLKSGIAEMLKYSLLKSQNEFENFIKMDETDFYDFDLIYSSILYKEAITLKDPFDEGVRQSLNLGHTIGHAIESYSHTTPSPLLHGEAIMLGLIYESILSHQILNCDQNVSKQLIHFKNQFFPELELNYHFEDLKKYLIQDKKNNQEIKMSLLEDVGKCRIQVSVNDTQIGEAISSLK